MTVSPAFLIVYTKFRTKIDLDICKIAAAGDPSFATFTDTIIQVLPSFVPTLLELKRVGFSFIFYKGVGKSVGWPHSRSSLPKCLCF